MFVRRTVLPIISLIGVAILACLPIRVELPQKTRSLNLHFEIDHRRAVVLGAGHHESLEPTCLAAGTIRADFIGANPTAEAVGLDELPGKTNYFIGNDPAKWRVPVPNYGKVRYRDVYPGIDVVYYPQGQQLEYDFIVGPGADPRQIRLRVPNAQIDGAGDLRVGGTPFLRRPRIYQGTREIPGRYELGLEGSIGFAVADYDRSQALVIDPVLVYSTFLGGSASDGASAIAVDSAGNLYVTGSTASLDFPMANPLQPLFHGVYDIFVTKISPDGSTLLYSTYIGGSDSDEASSIAVDAAGNVYVTGYSRSTDFPTVHPLQSQLPGGCPPVRGCVAAAVALKLNASGSTLAYSTYLGGTSGEIGRAIAVDGSGNAYIAGDTSSSDFPLVGALQPVYRSRVQTVFIAKLNAAGSALLYSSYLGGTNSDDAHGIALDSANNIYVAGLTSSQDFPLVNPLQSTASGGFVSKIKADGSAVVYSTFFAATVNAIAVDSSGNAYLTGYTGQSSQP